MQTPALNAISGGQGLCASSLACTGRASGGATLSASASPVPTTSTALSRFEFERAIGSSLREERAARTRPHAPPFRSIVHRPGALEQQGCVKPEAPSTRRGRALLTPSGATRRGCGPGAARLLLRGEPAKDPKRQ